MGKLGNGTSERRFFFWFGCQNKFSRSSNIKVTNRSDPPLITVWAGNRRLDLNKVQLNLAIVRLLRST